jgi:hypothetical protein
MLETTAAPINKLNSVVRKVGYSILSFGFSVTSYMFKPAESRDRRRVKKPYHHIRDEWVRKGYRTSMVKSWHRHMQITSVGTQAKVHKKTSLLSSS